MQRLDHDVNRKSVPRLFGEENRQALNKLSSRSRIKNKHTNERTPEDFVNQWKKKASTVADARGFHKSALLNFSRAIHVTYFVRTRHVTVTLVTWCDVPSEFSRRYKRDVMCCRVDQKFRDVAFGLFIRYLHNVGWRNNLNCSLWHLIYRSLHYRLWHFL